MHYTLGLWDSEFTNINKWLSVPVGIPTFTTYLTTKKTEKPVPHDTHRDVDVLHQNWEIAPGWFSGTYLHSGRYTQKTNMSSKKEAMFQRKVKIVFQPSFFYRLLGCPAGSDRNYLVSWVVSPIYGTYPTYLYRGEIIRLLSTMDIPVC